MPNFWRTRFISCDLTGNIVQTSSNAEARVSHYAWQDDRRLLVFCSISEKRNRYRLYEEGNREPRPFHDQLLKEDGHPSFSPCGRFLLVDTYPDRLSERHLLVLDLREDELRRLARFLSPRALSGEFRCDLHPRWSPDGRYAAIDSAHSGERQLGVFSAPWTTGGASR